MVTTRPQKVRGPSRGGATSCGQLRRKDRVRGSGWGAPSAGGAWVGAACAGRLSRPHVADPPPHTAPHPTQSSGSAAAAPHMLLAVAVVAVARHTRQHTSKLPGQQLQRMCSVCRLARTTQPQQLGQQRQARRSRPVERCTRASGPHPPCLKVRGDTSYRAHSCCQSCRSGICQQQHTINNSKTAAALVIRRACVPTAMLLICLHASSTSLADPKHRNMSPSLSQYSPSNLNAQNTVHADLASRAKRSRALGIFGGLAFMVTGFRAEAAAARNDVLAAITRNGGRLIEELPPVTAAELHGRAASGTLAGGHGTTAGGGAAGTGVGGGRRRRSSLGPDGGEGGGGAGGAAGSSRADGFPDIVICESSERRTCRLLSAVSRGAAVLTPQWVHDCVAAGRYLAPESDPDTHVIRPPQPSLRSHGLLAGLRVHLAGSTKFARDFGPVLVHAGALLMEQLEGQVAVGGAAAGHGARHGGLGAAHVPEPAADLLFMELEALEDGGAKGTGSDSRKRKSGGGKHSGGGGEASAAALQKRLQQLQRTARRLRVPVYGRGWLVDVVIDGRLPAALQQRVLGAGVPTPTGAGASGAAAGGGAIGAGVTTGRAKKAAAAAAWDTTPAGASSSLEESEEEGGGPGGQEVDADDLPLRARLACGGPSGRGAAAVPAAGAGPAAEGQGPTASGGSRVARRLQLAGAGPQHPAAAQPAAKPPLSPLPQRSPAPAAAAAAGVPQGRPCPTPAPQPPVAPAPKLSWLGAPVPPPAGLPPVPHRTFYSGFQCGSCAVHVGECVELVPQPGEPQPRVVQLECLWAERPSDGVPRMLARAKRFYRPEVRPAACHAPSDRRPKSVADMWL